MTNLKQAEKMLDRATDQYDIGKVIDLLIPDPCSRYVGDSYAEMAGKPELAEFQDILLRAEKLWFELA